MTLQDFKDAREAARREWHAERAQAEQAEAAYQEVSLALTQARCAELYANHVYRERKAEWRVARDFNLTSLGDVKVVQKLRGDEKL